MREGAFANPSAADFLWLIQHLAPCARVLEQARAHDLAAFGLDAPTRRLMDEMEALGPRPVPKIAKAFGLSRQAIQPLVDALVASGHAERLPNPLHAGSPLVRLTETGHRTITAVRARETATAGRMAERFLASHVATTRETLANLIFAYTGARAWDIPVLRPGYAAVYSQRESP